MSDIQKDPIQPGQAPMPQKDNTGLKVVLIVLFVIFGFPLIMIIIAFLFITLNFDKFTEWIDRHTDEYDSSYYSATDAEVMASAKKFYDAASGENVKVSDEDCRNIRSIFGEDNSSSLLMSSICITDKTEVGAKDNGDSKSLFFSNYACLEVIFDKDFTKYISYNYNGFVDSCDVEKKEIEFESSFRKREYDEDVDEEKDEHDEALKEVQEG